MGDHSGIEWTEATWNPTLGATARPMHPDWARDLRDRCAAADVPFFFKQWGEWGPAGRVGKKAAGRELDGRTWDEMPTVRVIL